MAEGLNTLNCASKTTTTLSIISQKRENKLKRCRRKRLIKIKADISESENSRINRTKSFFGRKTVNLQADQETGENSKYISKKCCKEMTSKSKQTKRTIKDYFAKLKINTFENLDE